MIQMYMHEDFENINIMLISRKQKGVWKWKWTCMLISRSVLKILILCLYVWKWTWPFPYKPIMTKIFFPAQTRSGFVWLTILLRRIVAHSFQGQLFQTMTCPFETRAHNSIAYCPQRSCVRINGRKKTMQVKLS